MKTESKIWKKIIRMGFVVVVPIIIAGMIYPLSVSAQLLNLGFGGRVVESKFQLCMIKIPWPPFVVPHPIWGFFRYYEVLEPARFFTHKLWDIWLLSKEYKQFKQWDKNVWYLGTYDPLWVPIVRESCTAKFVSILEDDVFGVVRKVGTGCKPGEILDPTGSCRGL